MKQPPTKMRKRERVELARLFTQLMRDLGGLPANPCEWTVATEAGPVRVGCIPDVPYFVVRRTDGRRYAHAPPIPTKAPNPTRSARFRQTPEERVRIVFSTAATWIAERIRAP